MKLFLGVDGGQSSTVALIADETGRVLGSGTGGPCNHVAASEGRAKFMRALRASLDEACGRAGLVSEDTIFEAACLGFSGGVADKDAYSRELIRSNAFKITIDAEIALTGATGGEPGIIVISGTGCIAFGKNATGKATRSGGWGYIFGDEGSAFDIVRQALRAGLAMEEGWGSPTLLRERLLKTSGAASANSLMHDWYNSFNRVSVARMAPLVDEAASGGDVVAWQILERAGRQLADLAERVYGRLFETSEIPRISLIGGVFNSVVLKAEAARQIRRRIGVEASPPMSAPAAGALLEALRMTGRRVTLRDLPSIKT